MAIVPAQVAGVPEIAACSPPGPSGLPHSGALAVCALLGVEEVYAVGGAQAVAAFAIGTASIPAVDMVVGPGNAYVEEGKRRLFGEVGIESLAGPTELVVVADASAPPEAAALDLLAQVEHGPGSQSVLVSPDPDVLAAIEPLLPAGERRRGDRVRHPRDGARVRERLCARAPPADGRRPRRGARGDPSRRRDLRRAPQRDGLRRLHRGLQPHPADGRAQPVLVGPLARRRSCAPRRSSSSRPRPSAALAAPLAALARAEGFVDHARSGEVRGSVPADTAPAAPGD